MKQKIAFHRLLDAYRSCLPEVQFEVFRWMIKTGWGFRERGRWGDYGVFECLYGLSSTGSQGYWYEHGFASWPYSNRLQLAFLRAIVSSDVSDPVVKWREKERIKLDTYRMLRFQESKFDAGKSLYFLLTAANKRLTTQLNSYHPDAVEIECVLLTTNGDQWEAILKYGYDGSSWNFKLAEQGNDSFSDFTFKAETKLKQLTADPKAKV